MTITVRSWTYSGPYYAPATSRYQASSLKELIGHVRMSMEENEQYIGIFHDDQCVGFWEDDSGPEPDGEGGWNLPNACYVLRRPDDKGRHFGDVVRYLKQA
jgi:hypothetical protein